MRPILDVEEKAARIADACTKFRERRMGPITFKALLASYGLNATEIAELGREANPAWWTE